MKEVSYVDFENHEQRITDLEKSYVALENKINVVETGLYRVENTVVAEFREQRGLLNRLIENQFKLDKQKLTGKEKVRLALISLLTGGLGAGGIVSLILHFTK